MGRPSSSSVVAAPRGTRAASSIAVILVAFAIAITLAIALGDRGPVASEPTVDAARPVQVHPNVAAAAKASLGRGKQLGVDVHIPGTGWTQPVPRGKQLGIDVAVSDGSGSTLVRSKQLGADVVVPRDLGRR